jgi:hypothetical protein
MYDKNIPMKKILFISVFLLLMNSPACFAGFLDSLLKDIGISSTKGLDNETVISGLKEALSIGTEKAVDTVSQVDGYLANEAIRILMPEKIQKVADILSKVGYQKEVDAFVQSMNHAAEKAAPEVSGIRHRIISMERLSLSFHQAWTT